MQDLLSDKLTSDQIKNLKTWETKIDMAIKVGKVLPQVEDKINEQIGNISNGQFDIDQVDDMIHAVLDKKHK